MPKFVKIILIVAAAVTFLVLSVLVAAWFGGNYTQNFQFNGVRGYEATAQIGLICGSLTLFLTGITIWMKRK